MLTAFHLTEPLLHPVEVSVATWCREEMPTSAGYFFGSSVTSDNLLHAFGRHLLRYLDSA